MLYHAFLVEHLYPDSERFHEINLKVLVIPMHEPASAAMMHEVFENYPKLAKFKARINRELACRLLQDFSRSCRRGSAERLQQMLDKHAVRCGDVRAANPKGG